jgi:hypothetical protein
LVRIKKKIKEYILNSKISRLKRDVVFTKLADCKTGLVLTHVDNTKHVGDISSFIGKLSDKGVKVTLLIYAGNKKLEEVDTKLKGIYFNDKDLNWMKFPVKTELRRLFAEDFDLMIDATMKTYFPLRVISSLSRAKFKVAKNEGYRAEIADLLISLQSENDFQEFLKQTIHYLNSINSKPNE